jgi:hypothetical protein
MDNECFCPDPIPIENNKVCHKCKGINPKISEKKTKKKKVENEGNINL